MKNFFSNDDFLDFSVRKNFDDAALCCEMSLFESAFLCGLVKKYKPQNILEIGVSAGGTTTLLLKQIELTCTNTNVISVDKNEYWYKDKSKKVGFCALNFYNNVTNWNLFAGYYLPQLIEQFNLKFDFIIVDTCHMLPGELLDCLVFLPFLSDSSIIVFHDIRLHFLKDYRNSYVNNILFSSFIGNKIFCKDYNKDNLLPNIGAIQYNSDNYNSIVDNLFLLLSNKWIYKITAKEFYIYYDFYKKFYGTDYSEYFLYSRDANHNAL